MGNLHDGHIALVRQAKALGDATVAQCVRQPTAVPAARGFRHVSADRPVRTAAELMAVPPQDVESVEEAQQWLEQKIGADDAGLDRPRPSATRGPGGSIT